MIPERIQLAGFLSYRDEQAVPFDGVALWMLSGANGSGKSAIFDGVTYALFGQHRGGSQNAIELINKESTELRVVFDFLLDERLHRIVRTLKRTKSGSASGTQQVFRAGDGGSDWLAVEDTNKKVDFDRWIAERVGLNYETFTSSVLLLQGKAEKLLDSKPSGRAEVLASVVDLKRFQSLHEKANQTKLMLKAQFEAIQAQTETVPVVSDAEFATAIDGVDRAETEKRAAAEKLDALKDLSIQAASWVVAEEKLAESREKLKKAEYLLGSAVKIERSHARMLELRGVLPAAEAAVTTRSRLSDSEKKTVRLTTERDAAIQRQTLAEADAKTAKRKRDTLRIEIEKNQKAIEEGNVRLRELSGILKSVELAEEQQTKLAECDRQLSAFESEPVASRDLARREVDRLRELVRILPVLQRVHDERNDLKTSQANASQAERRLNEVRVAGEEKKGRFVAVERESAIARQARQEADERVAAAAAIAEQAIATLSEFESLRGESTCRACGQALTLVHFAEEKERRTGERRAAEAACVARDAERRTAVERDESSVEAERVARAELDQLREDYRTAETDRKHAANETARHVRTLRLAYAELPAEFAKRIAPFEPHDWTETRFPEPETIATFKQETARLDVAERSLRLAEDTHDRWRQLRADRDSAARSLEKLNARIPAGDVLAIRCEFGDRQSSETAIQNAIRAARLNLAQVEADIDRLGKEAHDAATARTELVGKLNAEEVTRTHCRETIERELAKLAPDWRALAAKAGLNEYYSWKSEHDALVSEGIEATNRSLESARVGLATMREEIADREAACAAFPDRARQHPDQLNMEIVAARTECEDRERERETAHRLKATYDFHRARRAELGEQHKAAELEYGRYKTIAELLGRDRLQRHLVRQAERQIVDRANGVLDRLSNGQLFLKLTGADDGADRALDLECVNRATGDAPINVAFLSGSQKFRVAVALALGIGHYASRRHRPIESVIIDEGFGCLDRAGRQTMIQELQNLRGHLLRILLVSHQEDFADAFPDGYRFELVDGATRVVRIQR